MSVEEWKEVRFSDLVNIVGGGTPKTIKEEYWNGSIPWLSIKDFNNDNKRVYSSEKTITHLGLKESNARLLNEGDIIISARGTVGVIAQLGKPMAFNQSCYGLQVIESLADKDFVYYLLKNHINQLKSNTHGSVFDTVTRKTFEFIQVQIPPLEEQKAISKILSTIDDKIELNHQINQDLEEIAEAIFRSWFIDFEPFQEGEFVESELGKIPKGWNVTNLGQIAEINKKSIKPFDQPEVLFEHYSIPAYDIDKFPDFEKGSTIKSVKYLVNKNCVLVSKLNPEVHRVWRPLCISDHAVSSTEFVNIQPKDNNIYFFLLSLLKSVNFNQYLRNYATGSTNSRQRVAPKKILDYVFPFPTQVSVIYDFCEVVKDLYEMVFLHQLQNQDLIQLRDTLLPKLISGELRIPTEEGVESL